MVITQSALGVLIALFFFRLFGQGMLTRTAPVAMWQWFHAEPGKAISMATSGIKRARDFC